MKTWQSQGIFMKISPIKLLLIDDESAVFETVSAYGKKENMEVKYANNGELGIELFNKGEFDAIIIDWMLPEISGPEITKAIRKKSDVPIIMISARDDESDIVLGLELGADDYVTKPFSSRELMARIKASLRRNNFKNQNITELKVGGLKFCFETREIVKNGKNIELTPNEFRIFQNLYENKNRVVSREILMEKTLGHYDYLSDRTLDTHIKNLRRKLEDDPKNPTLIETIREVGFKFNV